MDHNFGTFSSRAVSIPGYTAPLFIEVIDISEGRIGRDLESVVQDILIVPRRHIVTYDKWRILAGLTSQILEDEGFWNQVMREQLGYRKETNRPMMDLLEYHRVETTRRFALIEEDYSFFTYKALGSAVYRASEGGGVGYDYGIPVATPIPQFHAILNDELMDRLEENQELRIGGDDLRVWRRVNNLIFSPVSPEFKESFSPVMSYEVPYGLSPKIESKTLEHLVKEARKVAIIPVLSGLNTTATALANEQWIVALQATATTGAVLIIFLGSVALADILIRWMKNREVQSKE